ncbi:MAG: protein kinase [Acidobacteria bacterium]|nr:protein kinase [Acidobacteriota bacterium]
MANSPPPRIGKYHVLRELGAGGMGAVFLARDPDADREVAIKVISDAVTDDEMRARFLREGRAAARLRHVNIVTIYEVGEHEARPFIAMEFVDGESLATVIHERRPLSLAAKLGLVRQVCDGLHFAHQAGIVHRDVKPANLMVDGTGVVRILDFGIARIEGSGMTRADALIGTLNYMSPEQMLGVAVDQRSDIFSLGSVAYELLSYRKAFPGSVADGLLHRLPNARPDSLRELCEGLDPEVEAIVWRALEKEPRNRYTSLAEMATHIERVLARLGERADQPTIVLPRPERASAPPSSPGRGEYLQRRTRQLQQHMEAAQAAFDKGDYEAAIARCEDAATLDPDFRPALTLLDRARAAQSRAQVSGLVAAAQAALDAGDFDGAIGQCEEALAADAMHIAAIDVLARARSQAAAARVTRLLQGAQAALDGADLDRAARLCDDALAIQPDQAQALALAQHIRSEGTRRRVRQILRTGQAALDQGDLDRARAAADEARALDPEFPDTLELFEALARRTRRTAGRQIQQHMAAAQAAFDNGDFEAAVARCENALALEPDHRPALTLLDQSRAAIARAALGTLVAAAETALTAGHTDAAIRHGEDALAIDPTSAAAIDVLARARAQASAARVARILQGAETAFSHGDFERARALCDEALAIEPDQAAAVGLARRARVEIARRRIRQILRAAQTALDRGDLERARASCDEAAALEPGFAPTLEMTEAIARSGARAAGRQKIEAARAALARSDFSEAETQIGDAATLLPDAPEIAQLRAELLRRRDEQEREAAAARAIAQELAEAEDWLAAGDLKMAAQLVAQVLARDRAHRAALVLRDRITTEERERQAAAAREIEQLLSQAQEHLTAGDFASADSRVAEALERDSHNKAARALRERIAKAAAAAAEKKAAQSAAAAQAAAARAAAAQAEAERAEVTRARGTVSLVSAPAPPTASGRPWVALSAVAAAIVGAVIVWRVFSGGSSTTTTPASGSPAGSATPSSAAVTPPSPAPSPSSTTAARGDAGTPPAPSRGAVATAPRVTRGADNGRPTAEPTSGRAAAPTVAANPGDGATPPAATGENPSTIATGSTGPPVTPPATETRAAVEPAPAEVVRPNPPVREPAPNTATAPPPAPAAPAPVPMIDRERPGIMQALERYRTAYQHRSVDELVKVYPALGATSRRATQQMFSNVCRAYDVTFSAPEITINRDGTVAQVIVSSTYTCTPRTAQKVPPESMRDTFQLKRNGDAWIIAARGSIDER